MANPILKFFAFAHLPAHLQSISKPFGDLADWLEQSVPDSAEKSVALRKLLEAKDAAVRAFLDQPAKQPEVPAQEAAAGNDAAVSDAAPATSSPTTDGVNAGSDYQAQSDDANVAPAPEAQAAA